jgi:membrane-associated protein
VDKLAELLHLLRDLKPLLTMGGYPVIMAIIFAETGLLVGFFLPGDSLLCTAGMLVNAEQLNPLGLSPFVNLLVLNAAVITMAIIGDAVGFTFGLRAGPKLFKREQSFFFRKDRLLEAQRFYETHGGKTIIIARFMPFARTFAPIVAGIGKMEYRRFAMFNIVGGVAWATSMTFIGYFLGKIFDAKQMERVVYLIIAISVAPLFVGWLKGKLAKKPTPEAAP